MAHSYLILTDSAADGQRILSGDDTLMEWLLQTVFFSVNLQLTLHGFRIHTDSHGRDLERSVQDIVPHQDIPVQFPIVVVRCSSVVTFSGF